MTAIRRSERSLSIPMPKARAKSMPRRSSGRTGFTPQSARTRSTAKALASLPASTPPRRGMSHRQARFGPTPRSAAVGQDPEHGEGVGILTCIDATKTGDVTQTGKIWSYAKIRRSISTVSITPEGLLFVGDFSGFLHCFDAETGKLYWTHDMKAHMWGSTLIADGKVYVGDEDGDLVVFEASKEKKILSTTNLGAPIYSTPVVANGVLYVSSNTHLFAFQNNAKPMANLSQPAP